jgi:hypothetical protein
VAQEAHGLVEAEVAAGSASRRILRGGLAGAVEADVLQVVVAELGRGEHGGPRLGEGGLRIVGSGAGGERAEKRAEDEDARPRTSR